MEGVVPVLSTLDPFFHFCGLGDEWCPFVSSNEGPLRSLWDLERDVQQEMSWSWAMWGGIGSESHLFLEGIG